MSPHCSNCDQYLSHDYIRVLSENGEVKQCWRCDTRDNTDINKIPEEPWEEEQEDG